MSCLEQSSGTATGHAVCVPWTPFRLFTGVFFDSGNPTRSLAWTARLAAERLGLATLFRARRLRADDGFARVGEECRCEQHSPAPCPHLQRQKFVNGATVV